MLRADNDASITSGPTVFQKDLKKIGDIPSGPGADKGLICFKACSTSIATNSLVSSAFIWGVTFVSIPCKILLHSVGAVEVNMCLK